MDASRRPIAAPGPRIYCGAIRFPTKEHIMGKYVLAWALGVPAVVVVVAYLLFH